MQKFVSFLLHCRITTSICRKWCQHSLQNTRSIRIQRSTVRIGTGIPSGRTNEKTVPGRASPKILTGNARHDQSSSHRQFYAITKVTDRSKSIRWFRTGRIAKVAITATNCCPCIVQFPGSVGKVNQKANVFFFIESATEIWLICILKQGIELQKGWHHLHTTRNRQKLVRGRT